jgi:hypothetical protein
MGGPNQLVRASRRPWSVPFPTHATLEEDPAVVQRAFDAGMACLEELAPH